MGAHTPRGPRHGDNRVAFFSMMTRMNSKELMNFAAAGKKNKNTHTNTHTHKNPAWMPASTPVALPGAKRSLLTKRLFSGSPNKPKGNQYGWSRCQEAER